jgi:hypothetical protein
MTQTTWTCAQLARIPLKSFIVEQELQDVIAEREHLDSDRLCFIYRDFVSEHHTRTAHADSLLIEIKRRFKNLKRAKKADGTYPAIDGATSFSRWCKQHRIGIRRAYYVVAGIPRRQIVVPASEPREKKKQAFSREQVIKSFQMLLKKYRDFDQAPLIALFDEALKTKEVRQLFNDVD